MQLEQLKTPSGEVIQGPLLITPQAFGDERGWFYESWNQRKFDEGFGESVLFSQDNHSRSIRGRVAGTALPALAGTPGQAGACHGRSDLRRRRRHPTQLTNLWRLGRRRLSAENKASFGFLRASPTAFSPSAMLLKCNTRREGSGTKLVSGPLSGTIQIWPLPGRSSGCKGSR